MKDKKVRLHEWDGKTLKEIASLTGNRGVVSALAFSPDGSLLTAGDVSVLDLLVIFALTTTIVEWHDYSV